MARRQLIGYAMSFVSFLIDSPLGKEIDRIILFGSVARGDFSRESDIDIFIDTRKDIEKDVEKQLALFRTSQTHRHWELKGVSQELSVKTGSLKDWSLRRDVISSGILLYGKFSDTPQEAQYYLLIILDVKKLKPSRQMSVWRKLYGYRQKVGKKVYTASGLLEQVGGRKLGKAVILVPMESRKQVLDFLNKQKVRYTVHELWSDSF